jgi:hypothetical protein
MIAWSFVLAVKTLMSGSAVTLNLIHGTELKISDRPPASTSVEIVVDVCDDCVEELDECVDFDD